MTRKNLAQPIPCESRNPFLERGTVQKITPRIVFVLMDQASGCKGCGNCGEHGQRTIKLPARMIPGAREGQRVQLSTNPSARLKASFLLFFLPTVAVIAGIFLGKTTSLAQEPIRQLACGLALSALTLLGVALWTKGKDSFVAVRLIEKP